MTIQSTIPARNQYIATSLQTVFPYTFEIFDSGDITVEQNGSVITAYTVSGVGVATGGNVTLTTGAVVNDNITAYRDMDLERLSDYQDNGDFLASTINNDLDRLWAALQQNNTKLGSAIRANISDDVLNSSNTKLANVATRAGKVLGFSAVGTIDYLSATIASGDFNDVSTTNAMAALTGVVVGATVVQTAAFSSGNKGGGLYDAVTVGTTANVDLPNTYNIIVSAVDSAICFVLRVGMIFELSQFGCVGDGTTDCSAAAQVAFDYSADFKKILTDSGGDYSFNTVGLIIKSNTTFIGNKATNFIQNYQVLVEPKSESLIRNAAWNDELLEDENITINGLSMTNGASIVGGSFITINKCKNYEISSIKIRKTSNNTAMNIGGYGFIIDRINIKNLPSDAGKIDGMHFEYIEDCTLSNIHIHSQDDCLGFAYFPAILPPRSAAEALANVQWGRDLASRNITVTNCVLHSDIANAIRIGNWANFEDLNQYMMPEGRFENMAFSNIIFNKAGATGGCIILEDYRHGASEISSPNSKISFSNMIINDFTSATQYMIAVKGNGFVRGFFDFATAGSDRNFEQISFNNLKGSNDTKIGTYELYGATQVTFTDCDIQRKDRANNEMITQLVDRVYLNDCFINSLPVTLTGNSCFFRDFEDIIISSGQIKSTPSPAYSDTTGDTDGSTAVITGMADTSGLSVGVIVTASAGFPAGTLSVASIDSSSQITLDTNSDSTQSNITLAAVTQTDIAGVRLQQPNLTSGGRVILQGTTLTGQAGGVFAVSTLVLDELQINANLSGVTGTAKNSLLTATISDTAPLHTLHANISSIDNNECRRVGSLGMLTGRINVSATIASGQILGLFPMGIEPINNNTFRTFLVNTSGTQFSIDYSNAVGVRTQSSIGSGIYSIYISYPVKDY